jgi:uncharacterized membrane protein
MTGPNLTSVEAYLEALRTALDGADRALIQDALFDAEEHLRAEIAQHPDESEAVVLQRIVGSYGAPDEVADSYRSNEIKVQAALRTPAPKRAKSAIGRFFGIYADPGAYLSLMYMLMSLITGVVFFSFAMTGSALSLGFAILIFGVPFFLLFIGVSRILALAEGRLVESMLGTRMPRRPVHPGSPGTWWQRIVAMLRDLRTWSTLLYFVLMLPLGICYFTAAVVGTVVPLALIIAPVALLLGFDNVVVVDDVPAEVNRNLLPLLPVLGIVGLTLMLHLAKAVGYVHGQLAKKLLVRDIWPQTVASD